VIEVMGRYCGALALYAGLAAGADCILVPEYPYTIQNVCATVEQGMRRGKKHTIVVVAEGAGHAFGLAEDLGALCGHSVKTVVLGHIQRGGAPSAFDRILASRMGARAVDELMAGNSGLALGLRRSDIVAYPLQEAYEEHHQLKADLYELARVLAL
jgi:6-phosphofructokinase 1